MLCLQAAPGPASPGPASLLSPSEEAQLRLERIFTTSVIPEVLVLACPLPRDGEAWAVCGCPRHAVCPAQGDCTPVSACQPHGPSPGDPGSREWMTRAVGGFGDPCPDWCAGDGELLASPQGPRHTVLAGMDDVLVVLCDRGRAGTLWLVRVLLLLSASHPLSSFSPPSLLPLAGPRRLQLGTQPGTVPLSSGALCLHQRAPAILCLPLGWRLCPCLVLERKAFPIPPCSLGCHGAGGCQGSQGLVPLPSPARSFWGARRARRVPSVEVAQLGRAGVWSRM